ncbi:MAG: hypothetical protein IJY96_02435 [Oscillospiraceae bacterium]|nr:hypothetical protein [Oscillospiraceae bacterium]
MDPRKLNAMWSISLMAIGIATFILVGSGIVGIDLPDIITRSLGLIDLIALPFLVFSTVKKLKGRS